MTVSHPSQESESRTEHIGVHRAGYREDCQACVANDAAMSEPRTEAGKVLLDCCSPQEHRTLILAIEEQAATEARRELLAKVARLPVLMREMFGTDPHDVTDLIDRAAVLALFEASDG
jgi:hypothetical protein